MWPCLKKWDNLLNRYLKRNLKYQDDILRAFAGIEQAMRKGIPGGFLFGLPQEFFDAALLWIPDEPLMRRSSMANGNPAAYFPSWSRAGWQGETSSQMNAFGLTFSRSNMFVSFYTEDIEVEPYVQWFKTDRSTGKPAPISNNYGKYRTGALRGDTPIPIGWTAHWSEGVQFYTYDRAPPANTFWWPIPTNRDATETEKGEWSSILYGETRQCQLWIGEPLPEWRFEPEEPKPPVFSLYTADAEWIGIVYAHQPVDTMRSNDRLSDFVIISSGSIANSADYEEWVPEWKHPSRPRSGDRYSFYHVLWIEWQDGIAYRRGLGRVSAAMWDLLDGDEVELYLG